MQRLIDADALIEAMTKFSNATGEDMTHGIFYAHIAPTIDAVPKEKILLFLNIANEELSKAHADQSMNGIMTWNASVTTLEGLLKEYDTADTDIVPVIRCKDCRYWWKENNLCILEDHCDGSIACMECGENDFCSRAERKGEDDAKEN